MVGSWLDFKNLLNGNLTSPLTKPQVKKNKIDECDYHPKIDNVIREQGIGYQYLTGTNYQMVDQIISISIRDKGVSRKKYSYTTRLDLVKRFSTRIPRHPLKWNACTSQCTTNDRPKTRPSSCRRGKQREPNQCYMELLGKTPLTLQPN